MEAQELALPLLRFPSLKRIPITECKLATLEGRRQELSARLEAVDRQLEARLRPQTGRPHDDELVLSADAWRALRERQEAEGVATRLRAELRQLQRLSNLEPCGICGQRVGPVHVLVGQGDGRQRLCLDCLEACATERAPDPESGELPPAAGAAIRAVEEEARCRLEEHSAGPPLRVMPEVAPGPVPSQRSCWHCGRSVDMVVTDQTGSQGHATLELAGLVPEGSFPDWGAVCMWCMEKEIEGLRSWVWIERTLCHPKFLRRGPSESSAPRGVTMLTVMSWNMNQRPEAWQHFRDLARKSGASVALLQEAKRPDKVEDDWRIHPPVHDAERWRIAVPRFYVASDGSLKPTRRYWSSGVAATGGTRVRFRDPVELHQVVDGGFACSHPGQFAVGDLDLDAGRRLTFVSLYGIWDPVPGRRDRYVEASLHRAISDLSVVLQEPTAELVLIAGDLNLYSYDVGDPVIDRSMTVWSRLAAYGLEICGPFRPDAEPRLGRCPCPDPACRHVNTYLYQFGLTSVPYQLDFFLATRLLSDRLINAWADPDPGWMSHSDHRPIFATFDV